MAIESNLGQKLKPEAASNSVELRGVWSGIQIDLPTKPLSREDNINVGRTLDKDEAIGQVGNWSSGGEFH